MRNRLGRVYSTSSTTKSALKWDGGIPFHHQIQVSPRGKKKKEKEKKQPRSLNFRSSVPFPISVTVKKIMPFVSKLRAKEISNSHDKCTGVESSASIKSKFLVFVGFCVCVLLCVVAFLFFFVIFFISEAILGLYTKVKLKI